MNSLARLIVFSILVSGVGVSRAQTACPAGAPAGSAQCYPDSVRYSYPEQHAPRWRLTWGAAAFDTVTREDAVVSGFRSKRAAEKAALAQCAERTDTAKCKILHSYKNTCLAIAQLSPYEWGTKKSWATDASEEEAALAAEARCSKINGGKQCKAIIAECSVAELVQ